MPSTQERMIIEYWTWKNQQPRHRQETWSVDAGAYYEDQERWWMGKARELAEHIDTLEVQIGLGNADIAPYLIRVKDLERALENIWDLMHAIPVSSPNFYQIMRRIQEALFSKCDRKETDK